MRVAVSVKPYLTEFVFRSERNVGNITTGFGFAIDALAKVVDDHVMKARAFFLCVAGRLREFAARRVGFVLINAIEDLDHLDDSHRQPGLFLQFAYYAVF